MLFFLDVLVHAIVYGVWASVVIIISMLVVDKIKEHRNGSE